MYVAIIITLLLYLWTLIFVYSDDLLGTLLSSLWIMSPLLLFTTVIIILEKATKNSIFKFKNILSFVLIGSFLFCAGSIIYIHTMMTILLLQDPHIGEAAIALAFAPLEAVNNSGLGALIGFIFGLIYFKKKGKPLI